MPAEQPRSIRRVAICEAASETKAVAAIHRLRANEFRIDLLTSEHPFFSLCKRSASSFEYTYQYGGYRTHVTWGGDGRATIWDKDILIYCASAIVKELNAGREPSRLIETTKRALLKGIRRGTSGADYRELDCALNRLHKTFVETNIRAGGFLAKKSFNLLASVSTTTSLIGDRERERVVLELCEWLYRGVVSERVLKLPDAYFELKGGLERRLFELARKHCGNQRFWQIGLDKLYAKSGSTAKKRKFHAAVRALLLRSEGASILNYHFSICSGCLVVTQKRDRVLGPTPVEETEDVVLGTSENLQ